MQQPQPAQWGWNAEQAGGTVWCLAGQQAAAQAQAGACQCPEGRIALGLNWPSQGGDSGQDLFVLCLLLATGIASTSHASLWGMLWTESRAPSRKTNVWTRKQGGGKRRERALLQIEEEKAVSDFWLMKYSCYRHWPYKEIYNNADQRFSSAVKTDQDEVRLSCSRYDLRKYKEEIMKIYKGNEWIATGPGNNRSRPCRRDSRHPVSPSLAASPTSAFVFKIPT